MLTLDCGPLERTSIHTMLGMSERRMSRMRDIAECCGVARSFHLVDKLIRQNPKILDELGRYGSEYRKALEVQE